MNMIIKRSTFYVLLCTVSFFMGLSAAAGQRNNSGLPELRNPMNATYLKKHLRKSKPRLVLNVEIESQLKQRLKSDPVVQNMYRAIQRDAAAIHGQPLLERTLTGRRLLWISREMLRRMNMLGMVYRIEKDPVVLKRINDEIIAVCRFSDWNPSHYLDVAEMAVAVAIALDWTAGDLPEATIVEAEKALIEKAILPSWPSSGEDPHWAYGTNNWNQVCNGGMIAASLAVAERDPELAAKTLHRALDGLPNALHEYSPSGIYPEGSTYWEYGTGFSVLSIAMLASAFGTDFGYSDYPGFLESATFRLLTNAPSGMYYNFADCADRREGNGDIVLAWFAKRTGNTSYFEKDRFLTPVDQMEPLSRLDGAGLVWVAQIEEEVEGAIPTAWAGDGDNPVVFFTGGNTDRHGYYFGGKGGRGQISHGNMDGGSFIFELDGVRWVVDAGNQDYHELEKVGFDLWSSCQDCPRWTLLTKNNFGHSTLTVNGQLHRAGGMATITDFKNNDKPEATIELTAAFGDLLMSAHRRFVKDSPTSLIIEDEIIPTGKTREVTWQLLTTADVTIHAGGALLQQDGKQLRIENISHPSIQFSTVSLYPAPLELDRQIRGLKRIELRVPHWKMTTGPQRIKIRLKGIN